MTAAPFETGALAWIAVSPDGAYVAVLWQRTDTPDLVARERVHVYDRASHEVVFALDGPAVVRALVWTSPTHLLVARDGPGRDATLSLHEAPDGGAVGRRVLPAMSQHRPQVRVSRDRDRALVTAPSAFDCKGDAYEVARVLALPSLDLEAEVDVAAVGARLGLAMRGREQLALHPDGHALAAVGARGGRSSLVVIPVAAPDEAVVAREFSTQADEVAWLGPRALVLRESWAPQGAMAVVTCDDAWRAVSTRRVPGDASRLGVRPLAVHPDGDHVLVATTNLRERPPSDPDDDEYGDYTAEIEVIACSTGDRVALGPEYGWMGGACWVDGDRFVASLADDGGGLALRITEFATGRHVMHPVAPRGEWARALAGGRVVTVTVQRGDREYAVLVDVAAVFDAATAG